jgi:hypothetical protein
MSAPGNVQFQCMPPGSGFLELDQPVCSLGITMVTRAILHAAQLDAAHAGALFRSYDELRFYAQEITNGNPISSQTHGSWHACFDRVYCAPQLIIGPIFR